MSFTVVYSLFSLGPNGSQTVERLSGRCLTVRETVGSLLNSQETVGSELARVLRELPRGAHQDVCQGCLQQVLLESKGSQTIRKLFASLVLELSHSSPDISRFFI